VRHRSFGVARISNRTVKTLDARCINTVISWLLSVRGLSSETNIRQTASTPRPPVSWPFRFLHQQVFQLHDGLVEGAAVHGPQCSFGLDVRTRGENERDPGSTSKFLQAVQVARFLTFQVRHYATMTYSTVGEEDSESARDESSGVTIRSAGRSCATRRIPTHMSGPKSTI
jgi:hypothetical protein